MAHPVRADAAQARFPGVDVRVHEAGDDDHPARIERFGVGRGEIAADRDDTIVLDEKIAASNVAELRIDGREGAVLHEGACHGRGIVRRNLTRQGDWG